MLTLNPLLWANQPSCCRGTRKNGIWSPWSLHVLTDSLPPMPGRPDERQHGLAVGRGRAPAARSRCARGILRVDHRRRARDRDGFFQRSDARSTFTGAVKFVAGSISRLTLLKPSG